MAMKLETSKLFLGIVLLALGITSCKEDEVFDQGTYNNLIKSSFPVQNVDHNQSWTTIGAATADISVSFSDDGVYDVGLYLEDPINTTQPTRVYEKKITGSGRISTKFSYKEASRVVYVGIYDDKGHGMSQAVSISGGRAAATISASVTASAKKPTPQHLSMRFLFEDAFPDAGDYDFNDCVFSITPILDENDPKRVTVNVTAEACGSQKTIGAAIRLVGVTTKMLKSYQRTKDFIDAPQPPENTNLKNLPDGDFTTSGDPDDVTSLVMLLFKDIHWVMNPNLGSNGSVQRFYYNAQRSGQPYYGTANVKTATYVFEFNNEIDAQRMLSQATYDAFIVESYNGSFWEVHTVQNSRKGALVLHADVHRGTYQEYLNAYVRNYDIGNLPWAIMVPGTAAYPYEGAQITRAYPNFAGWAQNSTANTNWYTRPTSGEVYPLH